MDKALSLALDNIQAKLITTADLTQRTRLKSLEAQIIKELGDAYKLMPSLVQQDMQDISETAYNATSKAMATHGASQIAYAKLPKRAINAMIDLNELVLLNDKAYKISDLIGLTEQSNINRFKQIVAAGIAEGSPTDTIARRLKDVAKGITKNELQAVTHTVIAEARSRGQAEALSIADDVITGYKGIGTLDSKTSPRCASLDGRVWLKSRGWTIEKLKQNNFWYPRHFRCRTIVVARTALSKEFDDIRTRAANGDKAGQISAKTDFQQFFDSQSEEFKSEYLGAGRYKLYKENKLEIKDFVSIKTGKLYTISDITKQMGIKAPIAPTISFGYGGKFDGYVYDIRDDAKVVIGKLPKPTVIKGVKKGSAYNFSFDKGSVLSSIDNKSVFNHEYGHHIDMQIATKSKSGTLYYSKKQLIEEYKLDRSDMGYSKDSFVKKYFEDNYVKVEVFGQKGKYKGQLIGYKYEMINRTDFKSRISDMYDSLSMGRIQELGGIGHGPRYYKSSENIMTENFANMFSIWSDGTNWKETKSLFPNMTSKFELIMKDIIDGKFD